MEALRPHERLVLDTLLAGDEAPLALLRAQASDVIVCKRTYTSVGEYVDLAVSSKHQLVEPANIILGDLDMEVIGVKHGVTTLLYVIDGNLDFIEFATAADTWPEDPKVVGFKYLREVETAPGSYALEPVNARDKATLQRALAGRGGAKSAA